MNARSDPQLLHAYAERRSEAAFAELVRRHLDFVHSAAVRMVNDPHLAKDVSQGVFVALAKDAAKLTNHPVLSGWLHLTARNIAAQTVRTEVRRRNREKEVAAMNEHPETDAEWKDVAPHLDAALAELSEPDRDAVLLRYFENKPAQEMAALLGISAEAAQKRVSRAVERLRENFAKRGISAGTAGLAATISANAVEAAPAGLATAISSSVAASTASVAIVTKLLAMTTLQKSLAAASVVALLAGTTIYQAQKKAARAPAAPVSLVPPTNRFKAGKVEAFTEQLARAKAAKPPLDLAKELEALKAKWLEIINLNSNDVARIERRIQLSKESAEKLLCSPEMLELIAFLKEHKFDNLLEVHVADQFRGERAAEARALLTALPETGEMAGQGMYRTGGTPLRDKWSSAAGKACPEAEFESFRAALNCKSCSAEATYGFNLARMPDDPIAALESSLAVFQSGVPTYSGNQGITQLFEADLPMETPWQELEEMIAESHPANDRFPVEIHTFSNARGKLFEKWAKHDPVAAANHVMENPARCPPDLISIISSVVQLTDPTIALHWANQFPDGPYYDEAAHEAVGRLATDHPDEARQLAERIGDPKRRHDALERIEFHQKVRRGEASFEERH